MGHHAVVIGSTGQIGRATVQALLDDDWTVTSVSRGTVPAPNQWKDRDVVEVTADRNDVAALESALGADGGADLVVDTIAYDADHARPLLDAAADIGHAVVVSSASVYADAEGHTLEEATGVADFPRFDGPIPEDQRTVEPGPATYSTTKIRLEHAWLDDGRVPVTVVRPCAIHGPGSGLPRELWPLTRALDGRERIPVAYGGRSVFHTTSVQNLAEVIRLAAARPATRVLNVGDPNPPDVTAIIEAVCATVGHTAEIVPLDGPAPESGVGRTPWSAPAPFTVDMTAAARELGYRPVTSYADAVTTTCDWLRERIDQQPWREAFSFFAGIYGDIMENYEAEDELLARLPR